MAHKPDKKGTKTRTRTAQAAVLEALRANLGVVSAALDATGVSRSQYYRWVREDEAFAQRVDDVAERTVDFAENALLKNIKAGSDTAIIFYLKTKGKHRGYIETKIIEGNPAKPVGINLSGASTEALERLVAAAAAIEATDEAAE